MTNVDRFIEAQPQRELLVALRALVRRIVPEAREEMKWRVPFYSHHGMLCCFEMSGRDAVVMCFCWGAELDDPDGILRGEWRRTRTVTVRTLREPGHARWRRWCAVPWHGTRHADRRGDAHFPQAFRSVALPGPLSSWRMSLHARASGDPCGGCVAPWST